MKVRVLVIGQTHEKYVKEGLERYAKRLPHYCSFEYTEIKDIAQKGLSPENQKVKEGELILKQLKAEDQLCLLDEHGKAFTSVAFSNHIQKKQLAGVKSWVLVIGGAFGFSDEVYARANEQIRLSDMTLPHDLVRIVLLEQLYRGYSILAGEKYHHI